MEVEEDCPICGSHSIPCDCGDDDIDDGEEDDNELRK
jgi:hypothetical protein